MQLSKKIILFSLTINMINALPVVKSKKMTTLDNQKNSIVLYGDTHTLHICETSNQGRKEASLLNCEDLSLKRTVIEGSITDNLGYANGKVILTTANNVYSCGVEIDSKSKYYLQCSSVLTVSNASIKQVAFDNTNGSSHAYLLTDKYIQAFLLDENGEFRWSGNQIAVQGGNTDVFYNSYIYIGLTNGKVVAYPISDTQINKGGMKTVIPNLADNKGVSDLAVLNDNLYITQHSNLGVYPINSDGTLKDGVWSKPEYAGGAFGVTGYQDQIFFTNGEAGATVCSTPNGTAITQEMISNCPRAWNGDESPFKNGGNIKAIAFIQ